MTGAGVRLGGALVMVAILAGAWVATKPPTDARSALTDSRPTSSVTKQAPELKGPVLSFDDAQLSYQDLTAEVGLDATAPEGVPGNLGAFAGGAAVGDYDGDGVADVMLTRIGAPNRLYRGDADGRSQRFDGLTPHLVGHQAGSRTQRPGTLFR
jgi:hypothetical protein